MVSALGTRDPFLPRPRTKESAMPHDPGPIAPSRRVTRRAFLARTGFGVAATALAVGRPGRAAAQSSPYPDWIPRSDKPPRRGGTLARASAWDPPVIDPRLTQSVGLFQFAALTSN